MKDKFTIQNNPFQTVIGVALTVACGLLLWMTPIGEGYVNASYDYLFRFGTHSVTNDVMLVLMDNAAFDSFHQTRGQRWDRGLHAQLLNKLADDGAAMVVMDSFFRATNNSSTDAALANAMHRQRRIVLMAEQAQVTHPDLLGAKPLFPCEPFFSAAGNWGVGCLDPDSDGIVRKHWPFLSPGPYPSLAWASAQLMGARLDSQPRERWLRYYSESSWPRISYQFALTEPPNYFSNKIVFIGVQPQTTRPDGEADEFKTPHTHWTNESSGGVEIQLAEFLNLVNGDWLQRSAAWIEFLILAVLGIFISISFSRMKLWTACIFAVGIAMLVLIGAVLESYYTNFWFPWLIISGSQIPCALAWNAITKIRRSEKTASVEKLPKTPGYKLFQPPFGEGAYGKVWLAKNTKGQWRAVKVIYLKNFNHDAKPYEREFNGVNRYKPISDKHPGFLQVDFVSEKFSEYFYYVMELGDSLEPDWHREPKKYKPRDLNYERLRWPNGRLPLHECVRIGLALTDALEFLHARGLTHRDIKPQNVIFVNDRPKLADLGLIAEIRPPDQTRTIVGTPGYMPPLPERPGTPEADIYALGMLLYVISTGRSAGAFPEIATTLVDARMSEDFLPLNTIILRACEPDLEKRYKSATEMHQDLKRLIK